MRLRLYDRARSGNCYRVRLMLGLLGLEYERIAINTGGAVSVFTGEAVVPVTDHPSQQGDDPARRGENRQPWFLAKNPRGQVPVLEIDGEPIWDSIAILVFLARRFGGDAWLPTAPLELARVVQWLVLSQNELLYGLAQLRGMRQMGRAGDEARALALARAGLAALEARLAAAQWLEHDRPTIADVACYPYVSLSEECGVDLRGFPCTGRWAARVAALPGYVAIDD